jgi:hypothetical protein
MPKARKSKRKAKEATETLERLDREAERGPQAFKRFQEAARQLLSKKPAHSG